VFLGRVQIILHALRLVLQLLVWAVAYSVQVVVRIGLKSREQRIEIFLRGPFGCDQLEGLSQGLLRSQATHKDLRELTAVDNTVAGVPSLPCIALQEDEVVLIGFVLVEPSRTNNGVGTSARANKPLSSPLPVVGLGGTVVGAGAVRHSDCSHQSNVWSLRNQRREDVSHPAVINRLRADLASTIRTMCEDDPGNIFDRRAKIVRLSQIGDNGFRVRRQPTPFSGLRTSARTECPLRRASSTTRLPILPVAPITRIVMDGLLMPLSPHRLHVVHSVPERSR